MHAYSSVLEEQEHIGSADLDSCPDCGDAMVTRGDEKVCAGCGTRQPVITVQAARHDWAFVAKMSAAVNDFWRRKAMGEPDTLPPQLIAALDRIDTPVDAMDLTDWIYNNLGSGAADWTREIYLYLQQRGMVVG